MLDKASGENCGSVVTSSIHRYAGLNLVNATGIKAVKLSQKRLFKGDNYLYQNWVYSLQTYCSHCKTCNATPSYIKQLA